jgi:hypothetical protein
LNIRWGWVNKCWNENAGRLTSIEVKEGMEVLYAGMKVGVNVIAINVLNAPRRHLISYAKTRTLKQARKKGREEEEDVL